MKDYPMFPLFPMPVVAEHVSFTRHSIVYDVKPQDYLKCEKMKEYKEIEGFYFFPMEDIIDKDLTPKTTMILPHNMRVCFATVNVTPQFYQGLRDKSLYNIDEFEFELSQIYTEGDMVGYILPIKRITITH